ncbi:helix-turn-helix domain-containing protein [Antrihabitans spumae]|uniref:Helix-turn-helix domain-containing protein n=1 Tax=Antrihabitans spumae TaxID=3373370 RepID=A0ABW7K925_9NOCA
MQKSLYSRQYRELCLVLRQVRREAGLTQVAVAERLDVAQSFVSKYESGERRLDVIELRHIAGALGITMSDILDRLEQ